jgi:DNA-binding transcriptional regulator YhcF (GntR family)
MVQIEKQIRHRSIVIRHVHPTAWRTVREIADLAGLECATVTGALKLMKRDKIRIFS